MRPKILSECLFLLITIVVALLTAHFMDDLLMQNNFYYLNFFSIIAFLTFTRYIFLLGYTPFHKSELTKGIIIVACIPLMLYLVNGFSDLTRFLDVEGFELHVVDSDISNANIIESQMLFFLIGAMICTVILPIRLITSIWKVRNRGMEY